MAKLPKEQKEEIFNNFKKRSDTAILTKKGEEVNFGDGSVLVRPLPWAKSNDFEDAVITAFTQFDTLLLPKKNEDVFDQIKKILGLLRDDLINIANIATEGKVTMESVTEMNASKADVIEIIVKAFELNYGYLKNLLALSKKLMK